MEDKKEHNRPTFVNRRRVVDGNKIIALYSKLKDKINEKTIYHKELQ